MIMEPFAKTAALVQQGLEQGAYPSACLSVGIGPRVLCRRTFGHVTGHTLYDMASVSKILGATMIALRWLEEGKLRLYDRVGAFLDAPADKADITILQLMTHTSGIPDHFLLQEECGSPEEVTQAILRHPLVQRPRWRAHLQLHGVHPPGQDPGAHRRRAPGPSGAELGF